jgi:hypothetical protein
MSMTMSVVMVSVIMSVAVMGVTESRKTHDVDEKTQNTDDQEFVQSLQLVALPQTLERVKDDLDADKPGNKLASVDRL